MPSGIRAEIRIDDPPDCTVTTVSAATDGAVTSVSKSVDPADPGRVTEDLMLEAPVAPDDVGTDEPIRELFAYSSQTVYRFGRDLGRGCPCERVEGFDCPVTDVRTRGAALFLTFHVPDMETLQAVIGELREAYATLDVRRLLQSQQDRDEDHLVFVDRSRLTDRQIEVLETAHEMGYFEHPKRANAGDVADALDITGATFAEHLAAGQTKILEAVLDR